MFVDIGDDLNHIENNTLDGSLCGVWRGYFRISVLPFDGFADCWLCQVRASSTVSTSSPILTLVSSSPVDTASA